MKTIITNKVLQFKKHPLVPYFNKFGLMMLLVASFLTLEANTNVSDSKVGSLIKPKAIIEDFSEGVKKNMNPGSVVLKTGSWYFSEASLDGRENPADVTVSGYKNAIRMRGTADNSIEGFVAQEFDYNGVKKISIQHAQTRFGSPKDAVASWELYTSKDGGNTWKKQGETVISKKGELGTAVFNINAGADEPTRIKIKNTSTPHGENLIRLNISEIKFEF